ncbi:MAG: hypothetical protein PHS48_05215 [Bacteroidales bacterium]|nr:hypothetical protein [Bacteroidales bacterium]
MRKQEFYIGILIFLFLCISSQAFSQRNQVLFFGDPTTFKDPAKQQTYRLKPDEGIGIMIENKKAVTLKTIYVCVEKTTQVTAPFVVSIKKHKGELTPYYLHPAEEFSDLLPQPFICKTINPGLYKIDIEKFRIKVNSDFFVLLSVPQMRDKTFDYVKKETIPQLGASGNITGYSEQDVLYYGPTFCAYPLGIRNIYYFFPSKDNAKETYAYSPNKGRHIPMIAVEYAKE